MIYLLLFFFPVVLEASDSQADKLLEHHLEIYGQTEQDQCLTEWLLEAWQFQIDTHFDSFGTFTVVRLIKMLTGNLFNARAEPLKDFLTTLKLIIILIMKLYRRNKQLEDPSKNEQRLAKELLQEVLDTVPEVEVESNWT